MDSKVQMQRGRALPARAGPSRSLIERVRLPAPIEPQMNMGEFPSGPRGQTVNLLRFASMVRIRPPPPEKDHSFRIGLFLRLDADSNPSNATVRWTVARCGLDRIDTLILPLPGQNANRIRPPPPCCTVVTILHSRKCKAISFMWTTTAVPGGI